MNAGLLKRIDKLEREIGRDGPAMTREQSEMLTAFRKHRFSSAVRMTSDQAIEAAGASLGLTFAQAKAIMDEPAVRDAQSDFWRNVMADINQKRRLIHEKWQRQ